MGVGLHCGDSERERGRERERERGRGCQCVSVLGDPHMREEERMKEERPLVYFMNCIKTLLRQTLHR